MKLVVITPSKDVPDEHSLVTKMFESGLSTLHLRKPRYSTNQMAHYISQIPEHFHNRIVIHSHHRLAIKFRLLGIHLSREHLERSWRNWFIRARLRMRFAKVSKSRSYSRLQQVYQKEEELYDYYLIGTMFNNMTGELYSGFYEDGVMAANKKGGKNLVARGGTSLSSISKANQYGFYGIAFNSFIWNSVQPFESYMKLLSEFKTNNISLD